MTATAPSASPPALGAAATAPATAPARFDDLLFPWPPQGAPAAAPLRAALERQGRFGAGQLAGRLFPIACVALEVTQRCNLDCSLCYLSDLAEATPDIPLDALMSRIDEIHARFGAHANIQVTGGDPTLRPAADLEAIVARIRALGMRSALFTNGIKADRALLARLARAGLNDVSFHVDTTQNRKDADDETALNVVRESYLERAAGLGLRVNFNTTLHAGNMAQVPALLDWFVARAEAINLASFQMQAETGRGTAGARPDSVSRGRLVEMIHAATGGAADFEVFDIGHRDCNLHASILVAGGRCAPLYGDAAFCRALFAQLAEDGAEAADWNDDRTVLRRALRRLARRPRLWPGAVRAARAALGPLLPALLRGRRPQRLSFFVHNFMSADALDRERCESCVFLAMTDRGPLSMCAFNADRDAYLMADLTPQARARRRAGLAFKELKGRLRARAEAARPARARKGGAP